MKTLEKTLRVILFVVLIFSVMQVVALSDNTPASCDPVAFAELTIPGYPNSWIFQASGIRAMYETDPYLTAKAISGPGIYFVRERTFRAYKADSPFCANQPVRQYASLAQLKEDLTTGAIPDDIKIVMYDPESWEDTPDAEQWRPVESIREFGRLAHENGYRVITIPHDSFMVRVARENAMSVAEAFDRWDIAGVSAEAGDITAVQAQNYQFDPVAFRSYVAKMVARARAVNPEALAFSELSTSPYDYTATPRARRQATPQELLAAYNAVRDLVDGFYVSINTSEEAGIAIAFLAAVQREVAVASAYASKI